MSQQQAQPMPTTIEPVDPNREATRPFPVRPAPPAVDLERALAKARTRIPPLWPLKSFVAVNPYLGLSSERFEEASQTLKRVTGANMVMPRDYYRARIAEGRITDEDLQQALTAVQSLVDAPNSLSELKDAIAKEADYAQASFVTVADVVDRTRGTSTGLLVVEEISKWCAAYWDEGQAAWQMPWRQLSPYRAWRAAAAFDRTASVMGIRGFQEAVAALPDDPVSTVKFVIEALGLYSQTLDGYLYRALYDIRGWTAYARYLGWWEELEGQDNDTVVELLAIRLAWDYGLFTVHRDQDLNSAWQSAVMQMREAALAPQADRDLMLDSILQGAFDAACQREFLDKLIVAQPPSKETTTRKAVQAAFCIDVRSEIYRRALESVAPETQTIGFAGFFGIPIEYVPIGKRKGPAHCPVLITPKFVVRETVEEVNKEERTIIFGLRLLRRRAATAWKSFKNSAVSSFVYVETIGLGFAAKLVSDSIGMTRTVTDPNTDGLDHRDLVRIAPDIDPGVLLGRETGFTETMRIDTAEAVLRAMSMTESFARLVLLAGHGSTTVNNPHASGYDCGACGGNPGEANARVTAAILNDPKVRSTLKDRGIEIPEDTWFLGGLHDTTTDEVTIFDRGKIPTSHEEDVRRLQVWLAKAASIARTERSASLNVGSDDVDAAIMQRSRDWSQVRPEWGLARNAAFIAAPRERTRGLNLNGRSFLHDYDWRQDRDWGVLELIMTAPMVVANWINLQYYGSSVDAEAFSSGNKVLHNVVGTLGVLEGNGGDLRVGLPRQAVDDGQKLFHEPLRLNVFLEAPIEQIDAVLVKHANVRELVDNRWLHLFALADEGKTCLAYESVGNWTPVRTSAS